MKYFLARHHDLGTRRPPHRWDEPATPNAVGGGASPPSSEVHSDCAGGETPSSRERRGTDTLDNGSLSLALDVHHHFTEGADLVGTIELVDDRGTRVHRSELAARRIAVRGGTRFAYATPRKLADGYYRVLVSFLARGADSRSEDFSSHESYLHIERGEVTPITSNEWLTQSNDGLVFTKP